MSRPRVVSAQFGDERPAPEPYPFRVQAWWGDQLVAESTAAVRVDADGDGAPTLYFPCRDIRLDLFHDVGTRTTGPGTSMARFWSIDATPHGQDVVWSYTEPAPEIAWSSGLATFDHDRVRIDVIDALDGDGGSQDVSIKRFPTWGDAVDLVDLLDVRPAGDGRFVSTARAASRRPVVEASQMLGQTIVAAGRLAPERRPVSTFMVIPRPADAREPLEFGVDQVSAGRTFTTLAVHVDQHGRRCGEALVLLDQKAPDVIRHAEAPPDVAGPHESEPCDMSVTGRDIRIVDGAYTGDPDAPVGPPVLDAWVRFRALPDDSYLHAGLLAQFTGHLSIAAALRPHYGVGQDQAHRTLSTAINAISLAFHREVRADRWMLYHHLSTFAGDGMTRSECRVYDEDGDLLASFTVEAMVRGFADPNAAVDHRTVL